MWLLDIMMDEYLLKKKDCLSNVHFIVNSEGKIIYVDENWSKLIGTDSVCCFNTELKDYFKDAHVLMEKISSLFNHKSEYFHFNPEIQYADGTSREVAVFMHWDNMYIDGYSCCEGIISWWDKDRMEKEFHEESLREQENYIEQLQLSNKKLRESEERFSLAMRGANDGLWDWDLKTNQVYYSPRWKEILGYTDDEIEPHISAWERLIHEEDRARTIKLGEDVIKGKSNEFQTEFRMQHKDGHFVYILSKAFLVRNENGEVSRLVGTHQDVTEQKIHEKKLIESEERHRLLSDITFEGIVIHDQGKIIYVNESYARMHQYTVDELIGKSVFGVTVPEKSKSYILKIIQKENKLPYETISLRKDGTTIPVEVDGRFIIHQGKQVRVAALRDITIRKMAEKKLRESEEKLNLFFNEALDGYFIMQMNEPVFWNEDTNKAQMLDHIYQNMRMVMVNDAFLKQHDLSREDVWSIAPATGYIWNTIEMKNLAVRLLNEGQVHHVGEEFRKDGTSVWIEGYYVIMYDDEGRVRGCFGMRKDITAQKVFENGLKESRRMLQAVLDTIPVRVFWKDLNLSYLGCNLQFARDAGLKSPEEIIGKSDKELPWCTEANQYQNDERHIMQNDVEKLGYEEVQTSVDGGVIIRRTSKIPMKNNKGEIIGIMGTYEDVTEKHRAEEEINKLALVAQRTDNSVIITDKSGNIEWVNDGFTRLSEYTLEEVVGKKPGHFLQGEDTNYSEVRRINRSFIRKKPVKSELLNYSKSGRKYWISLSIQPIFDENGNIQKYISVQSDITTRKWNEEELRKQNKQLRKTNQELDNFVYRVSHDLKAPIASVKGLVNLARLEIDEEVRVEQCLNMIEQCVEKLDVFILDILDYSRNARLNIIPEEIELKKLVEEVFRDLNYFDNFMKVRKILDFKEDTIILSDRRRLDFIFNNLISNAVRFSDMHKEDPFLRISVKESDDTYEISLEDNGIGIEEKYLDKIFNMFFRATEQRTGSGLGLYIVKEAVDKLDGSITVSSVYGMGSVFTLTLPRKYPD